jgi:hypothetical protein
MLAKQLADAGIIGPMSAGSEFACLQMIAFIPSSEPFPLADGSGLRASRRLSVETCHLSILGGERRIGADDLLNTGAGPSAIETRGFQGHLRWSTCDLLEFHDTIFICTTNAADEGLRALSRQLLATIAPRDPGIFLLT